MADGRLLWRWRETGPRMPGWGGRSAFLSLFDRRICIQFNVWRETPGQCRSCGFSDTRERGHTCPKDGPWRWRRGVA